MSRGLSGPQLTAIQRQEQSLRVHLLKLDTSGGVLYYNDGGMDIAWDGHLWLAIGGEIGFESIEESADDRAQGTSLFMTGVDTAILATLLTYNFRGRLAHLYRAYLNAAAGTLAGEPVSFGGYYMNSAFEIEEDVPEDYGASSLTIKTRIVSRLALFRQLRGIRTNVTSHQRVSPGDTFMQNIPALIGARVYWGIPSPPGTQRPR
jgi:hypothetical protein